MQQYIDITYTYHAAVSEKSEEGRSQSHYCGEQLHAYICTLR